jgi:hypothetical protein
MRRFIARPSFSNPVSRVQSGGPENLNGINGPGHFFEETT